MDLEGVIDLHVHAGPDVRPRKMTALELAREALAAGMCGCLFKNHHAPTVVTAAALRQAVLGVDVFGGVVLNESVGGLNPAAVEASLKMGGVAVWMPTLDAAHERRFRGQQPSGITVLNADGELKPAVQEILDLIAASDAILGMGHLAMAEIVAVLKAARKCRVRKIVVNHPEINFMNLSLADQRELAGENVFFERCYVRANCAVDWDGMARGIREMGVHSTVLATDLGQPDNVDPVRGKREMLQELSRRGFSPAELRRMACENPAQLLGLA